MICLPKLYVGGSDQANMEKLQSYLNDYVKLGVMTEIINDVEMTKYYIIGSCAVAMALGFFWMIIMKMCVACITWTVIALILLLSTALTYFIYDLGVKK